MVQKCVCCLAQVLIVHFLACVNGSGVGAEPSFGNHDDFGIRFVATVESVDATGTVGESGAAVCTFNIAFTLFIVNWKMTLSGSMHLTELTCLRASSKDSP